LSDERSGEKTGACQPNRPESDLHHQAAFDGFKDQTLVMNADRVGSMRCRDARNATLSGSISRSS
ncbi:MAG: hypothetical protein UT15_C0015G0008, partial [Berkelbacteria bacterium GW2011_GWA1_39_10]